MGNTTDLSFCAYTVSDYSCFVVFLSFNRPKILNMTLRATELWFYAGVAVLVDGQPIGTVGDHVKPHKDFDDRNASTCNDSQPWPVRFSN